MATGPFYDSMPGPLRRDTLNEMWGVWQDAIGSTIKGDAGWSPLIRSVQDGDRVVLEVYDWVGGQGGKPTQTGFLGSTGFVATAALAIDVRGPQGLQGIQGVKGDTGDTGTAASVAVGVVTTGAPGTPVVVTNSGTSGAAVLDFTIPRGEDGAAAAFHTHDAANIATGVLADARLPERLRLMPAFIADWNTAIGSGWYQGKDAANAPATGHFIGNVECHHERWVTQVVHAFNTDSAADTKTYRRESSEENGYAAWGPWYRLRLSEAEQAALRQAWWDSTAVPISKVTDLQTALDAKVAQSNVGSAPNEVPSNQHLGAMAFLDTPGATQVTQHTRDSQPGDVWHEYVSDTQLIKKFHGFDDVIRTITETYA